MHQLLVTTVDLPLKRNLPFSTSHFHVVSSCLESKPCDHCQVNYDEDESESDKHIAEYPSRFCINDVSTEKAYENSTKVGENLVSYLKTLVVFVVKRSHLYEVDKSGKRA